MHKPVSLGVALIALALSAAPAFAGVSSKKVQDDPDAVRAYWTSARMKAAKPVGKARPDAVKGKPGGTTTTWSTTAVPWPVSGKLTAHGKVFFSDGQYNYVCSGTAVGSNAAWTAGHCVNEGPGAFYSNFLFVPAYRNGEAPYGKFPAGALHTTDEWRTSTPTAYGYDLGAATLGVNEAGTSIASAIGSSNLRTLNTTPPSNTATGMRVLSYGYPAEGKFSGQIEYVCDSYVSRRDTSTSPPTYGIPCGMNGGSSGGGWVDTAGAVMSVNSYGYQSLKNTMFGPVQGAAAAELFTAANR